MVTMAMLRHFEAWLGEQGRTEATARIYVGRVRSLYHHLGDRAHTDAEALERMLDGVQPISARQIRTAWRSWVAWHEAQGWEPPVNPWTERAPRRTSTLEAPEVAAIPPLVLEILTSWSGVTTRELAGASQADLDHWAHAGRVPPAHVAVLRVEYQLDQVPPEDLALYPAVPLQPGSTVPLYGRAISRALKAWSWARVSGDPNVAGWDLELAQRLRAWESNPRRRRASLPPNPRITSREPVDLGLELEAAQKAPEPAPGWLYPLTDDWEPA